MEYPVPQFIESESKIIGPFTLKQFGFFIGSGFIVLMGYLFTKSLTITIVLAIFSGGGAGALVFLKIGGITLPQVIVSAFKYLFEPKKYLWQTRGEVKVELKEIFQAKGVKEKEIPKKKLSESRLRQTFWQIETGQKK